MSPTVNQVILIGHVIAEPVANPTRKKIPAIRVRVATDDVKFDRDTGKNVTQTDHHQVVAYGKMADRMRETLQKGTLAYFQGKNKHRKTGDDQWICEVEVTDFKVMRDGKGGSHAFDKTDAG